MKLRSIGRLWRTARRATNAFVPRAIILLYHRVSELHSDPQLLCVRPQHFADHLEVLKKYYRPTPLARSDQRLKGSVVLTFDDGYVDNLCNAKPLLERYDIPATVYITTGYVGHKHEFWWDELERLLLHGEPLPDTLCLNINGIRRNWNLRGINDSRPDNTWNVLEEGSRSPRQSLYCSLHHLLRPLTDPERRQILETLLQWAGAKRNARTTYRALCPDEVLQLAAGGLVEIGAHTVTHPVLSTLSNAEQYAEIQQSKTDLEKILGHAVTSFAYPYGSTSDYTNETVAAVRQAGYARACANFSGTVRMNSDRFQLPRFLVRDWDGDSFARQLRHWLDT
jgi:peptidoglycan/xylan/chitin deacetylase (PgdA/CDA1 family)